jgi:predicted unusual protein kinase regulating ubiquinone biosynthesis (AarF/ABC1/UbiB family)
MATAGISLAAGAVGRDPVAPLERATERLAELRGLATKAGQMVSVWTATLSPEDRARAAPVLDRLRAHTMSSEPAAVRALVERELGASIEARFASFEEMPFASASLGQVHRARLHEADGGLEVAVKVQHPGIDLALRADLDNVGQLGGLAAMLALSGGDALVAEVRARLLEEIDYAAEARWQHRFTELFRGDDAICIPRVVEGACSKRVLTTELIHGRAIHEACLRADARAQGQTIRRFLRTSWIDHGLLFADPHAGNWIFHEGARVTVLDFGSVVPFEEPVRLAFAKALEAIGRGDDASAERAVLEAFGARGRDRETLGAFARAVGLALAPLACSSPVRSEALARVQRVSAEAKAQSIGRRLALPPWLPLLLRALVGAMALLAELEDAS